MRLAFFSMLLAAACSDNRSTSPSDTSVEDASPDAAVDVEDPLPDTRSPDAVSVDAQTPPPPTTWIEGQDMLQPRVYHSTVLLADGRLLVTGGLHGVGNALSSAEIYDPISGSWSPTGELKTVRMEHSSHLLPDGRVIIVGGTRDSGIDDMLDLGTEIFEPKATFEEQWTEGPAMAVDRRGHCAVTLRDGRVFVAGGFDNLADHTSIEIYDPKSNNWSWSSVVLASPRNQCAATLLESGKVLISGGGDLSADTDTLEIFDPLAGSLVKSSTRMLHARRGHDTVRLPDGRVMIIGGWCVDSKLPCPVSEAELYDPTTDTISSASHSKSDRGTRLALLQGGEVVTSGGVGDPTSAFLFDGKSGWSSLPTMPRPHRGHTATVLPDNTVIVVGGIDEGGKSDDGSAAVDILQ